MSTNLQQALYVTVLGMVLVFVALGIIMLATVVLARLFQPRPKVEEEVPADSQAEADALEEEGRVAAAIAAAIVILDREAELDALAHLPESVLSLEHVSRSWRAAGRISSMG